MAVVVKPGKVRIFLDARKVSFCTIKTVYPMSLLDVILSRLLKGYISGIDLKEAAISRQGIRLPSSS